MTIMVTSSECSAVISLQSLMVTSHQGLHDEHTRVLTVTVPKVSHGDIAPLVPIAMSLQGLQGTTLNGNHKGTSKGFKGPQGDIPPRTLIVTTSKDSLCDITPEAPMVTYFHSFHGDNPKALTVTSCKDSLVAILPRPTIS